MNKRAEKLLNLINNNNNNCFKYFLRDDFVVFHFGPTRSHTSSLGLGRRTLIFRCLTFPSTVASSCQLQTIRVIFFCAINNNSFKTEQYGLEPIITNKWTTWDRLRRNTQWIKKKNIVKHNCVGGWCINSSIKLLDGNKSLIISWPV